MSLRTEAQGLLDRVLRHNEAMSNNSTPINSDFVVDVFLLENEILAFRAGVMDRASMQTLKDELLRIVNKYYVP